MKDLLKDFFKSRGRIINQSCIIFYYNRGIIEPNIIIWNRFLSRIRGIVGTKVVQIIFLCSNISTLSKNDRTCWGVLHSPTDRIFWNNCSVYIELLLWYIPSTTINIRSNDSCIFYSRIYYSLSIYKSIYSFYFFRNYNISTISIFILQNNQWAWMSRRYISDIFLIKKNVSSHNNNRILRCWPSPRNTGIQISRSHHKIKCIWIWIWKIEYINIPRKKRNVFLDTIKKVWVIDIWKNISNLLIWKIVDTTSCNRTDNCHFSDKIQSNTIEHDSSLRSSSHWWGYNHIICMSKKRNPSKCLTVSKSFNESFWRIIIYTRSTIDRRSRKHDPTSILTPSKTSSRTDKTRITKYFIRAENLCTSIASSMRKSCPPDVPSPKMR